MMKRWKNFSAPVLLSFIVFSGFAFIYIHAAWAGVKAAPDIEWEYSYGGSGSDEINSIRHTSDGGYIFAGSSASPNDGDISGNQGLSDYWVMKLDGSGRKDWSKLYGGVSADIAFDIIQTASGDYIVTGKTESDIDFPPNASNYARPNKGGEDAWMIRLDEYGDLEWTLTSPRGGSFDESLTSVVQSPGLFLWDYDNNYYDHFAFAGYSESSHDQVGGNAGGRDFWIIRLYDHHDHYHGYIWKTYGGSGDDEAKSIRNAEGGGYIAGGTTYSNDGDVSGGNHGGADCWILKLDDDLEVVQKKTIGGAGNDYFTSLQPTSDGYVMAGQKEVAHGDHSHLYCWIVKLDASLNVIWDKTYEDFGEGEVNDIQRTDDGGYIIVYNSISAHHHDEDGDDDDEGGAAAVKLDSDGEAEWSMPLGSQAHANSIRQTADGGYIIGGTSYSDDAFGDGWVLKLSPERVVEDEPLDSSGGGCGSGAGVSALIASVAMRMLAQRKRVI